MITLTPTATEIPSDRLAEAHQSYKNGDYETAQILFATLAEDESISLDERITARHWRGRSELQRQEFSAAILTFDKFLADYPENDLNRVTRFNLGLAYEKEGQWENAIIAYLGAIKVDDVTNVYIYERIGDIALQTADFEQAIEAYQAGADSTEATNLKVHLLEGIADAYLRQDKPTEAIDQYKAILSIAEIDTYRAKILRLMGDAYLQADQPNLAYTQFQEAFKNYPQAYESYVSLTRLVKADQPVDEFQRGVVDYYAQAYQPAIDALDRYLASPEAGSDDPSKVGDALWYRGKSYLALGRFNSSIFTWEELIKTVPEHENWGQAHLEIGKARVRQDNITEAKSVFRRFANANPENPLAAEALWRAARLELDGDLLPESFDTLTTLADNYPTSNFAPDALYWAGRSAFLQNQPELASKTWQRLLEDYPDSTLASFGGYWQSRALRALGDEQAAEAVLTEVAQRTDEYYGLRARDVLAGTPPQSVPLVLPSPTQLVEERADAEVWLADWLDLTRAEIAVLKPEVQSNTAFQRGHTLLEFGLRPEALAEFETVKDALRDDPLAMYQLAVYFSEQGLGRLSIVTATRLVFLSPADRPEDAPIYLQRLYYPFKFSDLIFAESEAQGIDPALVLAITRQESLFEPSAESWVGARGLMQVMPTTGEYVAERSEFGEFHIDQLWQPYISIKFGAWYIDQQLGIFDGNQFAALAAYNAGPGNVLEWVKISDDLDFFVEAIPFRESRTYIRKIYVNLAAYRRIYGVQ